MKLTPLMSPRTLALICVSALPGVMLASQVALADVLVDPANPDGWAFSNTDNTGTDASGQFVTGPATPPLGTGSVNFTVGNSSSSEILRNIGIDPGALNDNFGATYSTYVTNSSSSHSGAAPTLQFDLFQGATYEGRLVFDPGLLGTVVDNQWQSWNTNDLDAWYFSDSVGHPTLAINGECTIAGPTYCSLSQAIDDLSTSNIDAVDVLFKAGGDLSSFNGNFDDLALAINGTTTTYNFDPNPVPEPASLILLGTALAGLGLKRRRKRA